MNDSVEVFVPPGREVAEVNAAIERLIRLLAAINGNDMSALNETHR